MKNRAGYGEDRHDEEEEDDYYSPSDIYRAVLKNNAGKRDHESEGKKAEYYHARFVQPSSAE